MICLKQKLAKLSIQVCEGKTGSTAGPCAIPVEVTEEHLVDRSKKPFDAPTATWFDLALLQHVSTLGWEHINLTGAYTWHTNKRIAKGGFRPLRSPGTPSGAF